VAAKLQFIGRLEDQGLLSGSASAELCSALRGRDLLVAAAFDVGERTQDAKHLTKLLQELARLRLGPGSTAPTLTAMTEMVACARDVAKRAGFNGAQYIQLANTALCFPSAAEEAFVYYRETQDPAAALNHLLQSAFGIDDEDDEEEEGTDSDDDQDDDIEDEDDDDDSDEDAAIVEEEMDLKGESEVESVPEEDDGEDYDVSDEEEEDDYEAGKAPTATAAADEDEEEYEEDFEDDTSVERSSRQRSPTYDDGDDDDDDDDEEKKGESAQKVSGEQADSNGGVGSELASILVRLSSTLATLKEHEAYVEQTVEQCLEAAKGCLMRDDRDGAMDYLKKKQVHLERRGRIVSED
jgi:hypothetical protein